jgi:hypothetical protein
MRRGSLAYRRFWSTRRPRQPASTDYRAGPVAICRRYADDWDLPRELVLGCAIAESDLDALARRPHAAELDAAYWPDVSGGLFQQTVRWSKEYAAAGFGGEYPGPAFTESTLQMYYDMNYAASVAIGQLLAAYRHTDSSVLDACCFYNSPNLEPLDNPNRENYRRGIEQALRLLGRPVLSFDGPPVLQPNSWGCSVAACTFMLRCAGEAATFESTLELMWGLVTESLGLLDGSGDQLVQRLRSHGLRADRWSGVAWSQVAQAAGKMPMMIGGANWYHWVGVRGYDPVSDVLSIANPAPGYLGVWAELSPGRYAQLGPFAAVWLPQS